MTTNDDARLSSTLPIWCMLVWYVCSVLTAKPRILSSCGSCACYYVFILLLHISSLSHVLVLVQTIAYFSHSFHSAADGWRLLPFRRYQKLSLVPCTMAIILGYFRFTLDTFTSRPNHCFDHGLSWILFDVIYFFVSHVVATTNKLHKAKCLGIGGQVRICNSALALRQWQLLSFRNFENHWEKLSLLFCLLEFGD